MSTNSSLSRQEWIISDFVWHLTVCVWGLFFCLFVVCFWSTPLVHFYVESCSASSCCSRRVLWRQVLIKHPDGDDYPYHSSYSSSTSPLILTCLHTMRTQWTRVQSCATLLSSEAVLVRKVTISSSMIIFLTQTVLLAFPHRQKLVCSIFLWFQTRSVGSSFCCMLHLACYIAQYYVMVY